MGVRGIVLIASVLLAGMPFAGASDPFQDPTCVGNQCWVPGTCVSDVVCAPRGCAPAECRGDVAPPSAACTVNATIQGETCATYVSTMVGAGDGSGFSFAAGSSNGSVRALNLPNAWVSPGIQTHMNAFGLDLGYTYVYIYTSDINTEGPRGGPLAPASSSPDHTWNQIGLSVGTVGQEGAVAVVLLDQAPEGCFVRSPTMAPVNADCPRFSQFYP